MDAKCLIEAKIGRKEILKEKMDAKGVCIQTGCRMSCQSEPSVHKDPLFDEIPEDTLDYMETKDAQDVGRTRDVVDEEKEDVRWYLVLKEKHVLVSAQQKFSTDKEKVSTDRPIVSTDGSKVSTDKEKDSTDRTDEGTDDQTEGGRATQTTQTPTSTIFGDDETIAHAEKKFKQLASDEEMARKVQEEWEGNFKHSDLKTKKFEEIQALYEKIKRSDEDFISIGSAEDERLIKKMNEKGIDSSKNESVKEEGKEEEDSEIMEKKSVIARLNKVSSPDGDYLVIYRANGNFRAFNYLMEILHIFDRQDLFHLYDLMREQYSGVTI
ncbi:hypothetical protein Tco_0977208 [Tanacetum coccineum]|uniref:Uncharacterized protein n=1 Tax=Tanacetum coccineum TaxID=301880 RepID=A0ABQ5EJE8_9ASTR